MKTIYKIPTRTLLSVCLAMSAMSVFAQNLGVGSPAPEMKVGKWVKGTPLKSFETGKVYVVEFWATWCGPCRETIPHIAALAKQYAGKAEFAGVSVWEQPETGKDYASTLPLVEKFVQDMGPKMDYRVASDNAAGHMALQWMKAAGQEGIPAAFLIDQKGRVAWIGHPTQLEGPLAQVVAGTYDLDAAAAKWQEMLKRKAAARAAQEQGQAEFEAWQKTPLGAKFKQASQFQKDKKYDEAIAIYNEIAKMAPDERVTDTEESAALGKFRIYEAKGDMEGYYAMGKIVFEIRDAKARKLIQEGMDITDPETGGSTELSMIAFWMNNTFSWPVADPKSKLPRRDFDFAIRVAERVAEITRRTDPNWLDTLACAYFGKGLKEKAIATQREAIALFKGGAVPPEYLENLKLFTGGN